MATSKPKTTTVGKASAKLSRPRSHKPSSVAVMDDVKDAVKTEALAVSEDHFRAILDATPTPQAINDSVGKFIFLNAAFTQAFGYTIDEIPTIADWWPKACPDPAYRQWVIDAWQAEMDRATHSGPPFTKMALTIRAKDGTNRYVQASAAPFIAGYPDAHLFVLEDVTAIYLVNEQLRAAEHQVNVLFNATDAMVWEADALTFLTTTVSPNVERVFGYAKADWPQPGFWANHIHPDDRHQVIELCAAKVKCLQPFDVEYRFIRADGRTVWVRDKVTVVTEADQPRWLRGMMTDITAEKQATAALKESEGRWKFAIEGAGDGLWDWNIPANTAFFSSRWKSMLGFDDAEIGNSVEDWSERVHADELADAMKKLQSYLAGATAPTMPYSNEHRMRCKDGSWKWILSRGMIMERDAGGAPIRMIGTHTDVTARRASEETLRTSALALKNISQGVVITNTARQIVSANAAFTTITGYEEQELLGRKSNFMLGPLSDPATVLQIREAIQAEQEFSGKLLNYRKDGTPFWNELTITPVRDAKGVVVQYVRITRDVTERERAKEQRTALEEQLRESQKMEAIGTLAGGIAHDFNNIIAAIQANTLLALEDAATNPETMESLTEIAKATTRARDLVQQILSFSRRQATALTVMSLVPVIEESARLLRATLPPRLALRLDLAAGVPNVNADATQIEQILINVCTNAMYAMHARPGRIDVILDTFLLDHAYATAHPEVQMMFAAHPGQVVRVAVRDNGPGMDEATLARVFEPFFTTKPVGEGTGLGLAVVHGIAQNHDGAIFLESELGRGTTFTLLLPAAVAVGAGVPPPAVATAVLPASLPVARQHVLLLDDDEPYLSVCTRLLARSGLRVSAFSDQDSALAAIRAEPLSFDLLVTDYNMPGVSGLDVCRAALAINPDLPVVLTSGFIDDDTVAAATDAGVVEIIFKASDINAFRETVKQLAEKFDRKRGQGKGGAPTNAQK